MDAISKENECQVSSSEAVITLKGGNAEICQACLRVENDQ